MTADSEVRRLNWGSGTDGPPDWINSDIKEDPRVDIAGDILDGLPLETDSIDYALAKHAFPELPIDKHVPAMAELRRVLKPGGVLRVSVPDLLKGVDAYRRGDRDYFLIPDEDAESLGAKLITQLVWYGYSRTLYVPEFVEELLRKAGFTEVHHVAFQQTASQYPGIIELDDREPESIFVEAVK